MNPTTAGVHPAQIAAVAARLRSPACPYAGRLEVGPYRLDYRHPKALAYTLELVFQQGVYDFAADAPATAIVDGGSWLGLSVLRLRELFPDVPIVAVEPDPELFRLLRLNMTDNRVPGVELVNAALAARPGTVGFDATGTDAGSVVAAPRAATRLRVPAVPLGSLVRGPGALVKLNIEGSEWPVLQEFGDRLADVDQLLIEYHGFAELPQTLHLILGLLHEQGFTYLVSHINDSNRSCVPPLRLASDYRWFSLVYARRLGAEATRAIGKRSDHGHVH